MTTVVQNKHKLTLGDAAKFCIPYKIHKEG
jgi:hypothetical protein